MINNLYLKKFANDDSFLDKARLGVAEAIDKYHMLSTLLGAGIGGTAGYFISDAVDKDLEKKYKIKPKWYTKIFPTVTGALAGGLIPTSYYLMNQKDLRRKYDRERDKRL